MKKLFSVLAVAAAAAITSAPAAAAENFLNFTIDETSVPGTGLIPGLANTALVGDKLNGGFTEYVTFTGVNTFSAQAYANIGQIFANEGTALTTNLLNSNELVGGYRMYALFAAQGTFSGLNFIGNSANFYLYIDPNSDTDLSGTDGVTAITVGDNSDDYLVAYTTSLASPGTGTLASAPGAYNFDFKDFVLTSGDQNAGTAGNQNGEAYFVQPRPFHILVQVNGDNDQAVPLPGSTLLVTGDVSAVFKVPEPGSLALVGTLLAGLGLATRRRKA
ncbi:MAG: flocculation-associated PEP-CTERM protein PepA [Pseudomonadota bacterium]